MTQRISSSNGARQKISTVYDKWRPPDEEQSSESEEDPTEQSPQLCTGKRNGPVGLRPTGATGPQGRLAHGPQGLRHDLVVESRRPVQRPSRRDQRRSRPEQRPRCRGVVQSSVVVVRSNDLVVHSSSVRAASSSTNDLVVESNDLVVQSTVVVD